MNLPSPVNQNISSCYYFSLFKSNQFILWMLRFILFSVKETVTTLSTTSYKTSNSKILIFFKKNRLLYSIPYSLINSYPLAFILFPVKEHPCPATQKEKTDRPGWCHSSTTIFEHTIPSPLLGFFPRFFFIENERRKAG